MDCSPSIDQRDWRRVAQAEWTAGDRVCGFIESYCLIPEGRGVGEPMRLHDFQRRFIYAVYDNPAGTRRGILSTARKNGKTALIAALALVHICGPMARRHAQIVSGARSLDQAGLVYSYAEKMIALSDTLRRVTRTVPNRKIIVGLHRGTEYRALSAESSTAMGLSPVVIILDELGQVQGPTDEFVNALITSQGAHDDPLQLAISTQAPTDADLLSLWIDDALGGQDPQIVCHLYAAAPKARIDDPAAWHAANPGIGAIRSLADIEAQARDAMRLPSLENSFRNLILNQRVQRHSPFLSPDVWEDCGDPVDEALFRDGRPVWGGLDLSSTTDLTALVLTCQDDAGRLLLLPYAWTPGATLRQRAERDRAPYELWVRQGYLRETPGKSVDYDHVAAELAEITASMNLRHIAYDRWRIDILRKALERIGAYPPLEPFGQGYRDMSPAIEAFERAALEGALAHGGHPLLRWCMSNAVIVQDPAGNRKLDRAKAYGRIDAAVAAVMAVAAARTMPQNTFDVEAMIG